MKCDSDGRKNPLSALNSTGRYRLSRERARERETVLKGVVVYFKCVGRRAMCVALRDIGTVQPPCLLSRLSLRDVGGTRERRE